VPRVTRFIGLLTRDLDPVTARIRAARTLAVSVQQLLPYTDLYKQAEPGFFAVVSYARFRLHCVPRAAQTQVGRT